MRARYKWWTAQNRSVRPLTSVVPRFDCATMTRHSKNNTANSVFSKAEYDKLKAHYGTQRALLGSKSHRAFNACSLCLSKAVNPVSCSKGHLFCKECVMKDLLSQRDGLARKKQEIEAIRKEEEAAREEVRLKARERVLSGNTASLFGKRKERDDAKEAN
ncbi:12014_t:CDS:1, partial [Acaulospora colombiana]